MKGAKSNNTISSGRTKTAQTKRYCLQENKSYNKIKFIEFEVVSGLQGIGKQKKNFLKKGFFFVVQTFHVDRPMILNRGK